jgi:hypothetical protein
MKKIIVSLILLSAFILPISVMAAIPGQPGAGSVGDLDTLYETIGSIAWKVFAIIALLAFIVAGILFLTAGGDPEKIKLARTAFIWGIVGIVVAILAFSIVGIISNLF